MPVQRAPGLVAGNPRDLTARRWAAVAIAPALKELAGLTTDDGPWIYLSMAATSRTWDCTKWSAAVAASLWSAMPLHPHCSFEDLGNAVRKIYIDFE